MHVALGKNGKDKVTSWEHLQGHYANMTPDEWHEVDHLVRHDPVLAKALAKRGITDLDRILVDVWAYGAALVPPKYAGRRIGWSDVWVRGSERGNPYAHPVGGLHPIVDLNEMKVLEIEDTPSPGMPKVMGEYVPDLIGTPLREVKPLEITQPKGVSFTLEGNLLRWQNWEMRLGFNYREGLVLHMVEVDGDAGERTVIAGFHSSTLDSRSAFVLFRHPEAPYLVQCRASYDVTHTPPVTSNGYKLQ